MRDGITNNVRAIASCMDRFTALDLEHAYHKKHGPVDFKRIQSLIKEMRHTGEMISISKGVYTYKGRKRQRTKTDIIWNLVRSRPNVSTDDIERLSGAKRSFVSEYLNCLVHKGYLRRVAWGQWILIKDPGPKTPVNTAKRERLRQLRKEKKFI